MNYGLITTCIIVAVCVLAVLVGVIAIKRKISDISMSVFGTKSFSEGMDKQRQLMSETPRSLHSMTAVYLPQIKRDFPDFDYDLYKNKAGSMLKSYFNAVESKDVLLLAEECSLSLKNQVRSIIEDLNSRNENQIYDCVVLHDTQVARYVKNGATVTIVFVISVGYLSYIKDESGKVVFGDDKIKQQTVYETELVYVQDVDKVDTQGESLGINCPNCGAPIKNLGKKFCEYCGTSINEINIRSWKFVSVKEQTVNKRQFS